MRNKQKDWALPSWSSQASEGQQVNILTPKRAESSFLLRDRGMQRCPRVHGSRWHWELAGLGSSGWAWGCLILLVRDEKRLVR